jgi:hypothetical protein
MSPQSSYRRALPGPAGVLVHLRHAAASVTMAA